MLQRTPEHLLDGEQQARPDDAIVCRQCGHLISRSRWRISVGGHAHRFSNPLGIVYEILCFDQAPGARPSGPPSEDHTWFNGYAWRIVQCAGCRRHIGWQFVGTGKPPEFYGLIKGALSVKPDEA